MKRQADRTRNIRRMVVERDSYTCCLCSNAASDVHHVIPRSQGGSDSPQNLVSLCRCHHDLVHGRVWHGVELTPEEAKDTIFEYITDYYADTWEPPSRW